MQQSLSNHFVTNHYQMQQACGNGKLNLDLISMILHFINKEMV